MLWSSNYLQQCAASRKVGACSRRQYSQAMRAHRNKSKIIISHVPICHLYKLALRRMHAPASYKCLHMR